MAEIDTDNNRHDDEPGGKRLGPHQNPPLTLDELKQEVFSNGLIIGKILQHLSLKQVLSCRLVSKEWGRESNKIIRANRRMVRFDPTPVPYPKDYSRYFQFKGMADAEEFISVALNSSGKIFTRFSFLGNQLNSAPIAGFLETYGPSVVEVEINWELGQWEHIGLLSAFREVLFFALPNLRILQLKNVPGDWLPENTPLSTMFPTNLLTQTECNKTILNKLTEVHLDLFQHDIADDVMGIDASYCALKSILEIAPNVQRIPHLDLVWNESNYLASLIALISNINRTKKRNILKGVIVMSSSGIRCLYQSHLSEAGIFLERLCLSGIAMDRIFDGVNEVSELYFLIQSILENQKSSLKFLYLQLIVVTSAVRNDNPRFVDLPKMDNLVEIGISLWNSYHGLPSSDSFTKNLPNLRKVYFDGESDGFRWDDRALDTLRSKEGCNETVKVLKLTGIVHTPAFLEWMATLFPNVKHLTVTELNEIVYPTLWRAWPDIESFCIQNTTNLKDADSIFTGVKAKKCRQALRKLARPGVKNLAGGENDFQMWCSHLGRFKSKNIGPAITKWTKLRRLRINYMKKELEPENENRCNYISDITGCTAFSKIRSLQELILGYSKISTYCRKLLESRVDYVNISDSIIIQP